MWLIIAIHSWSDWSLCSTRPRELPNATVTVFLPAWCKLASGCGPGVWVYDEFQACRRRFCGWTKDLKAWLECLRFAVELSRCQSFVVRWTLRFPKCHIEWGLRTIFSQGPKGWLDSVLLTEGALSLLHSQATPLSAQQNYGLWLDVKMLNILWKSLRMCTFLERICITWIYRYRERER